MAITYISRLKNLKNKTVILRVDWNIGVEKGMVIEDSKIEKSLETISYLVNKGARVLIISHFGRPGGKKVASCSLQPVVDHLNTQVGFKAILFKDDITTQTKKIIKKVESLEGNEIGVLENIRFYPEEKKNTAAFAKKIAELGDIYVNDAFAGSHRKHASIVGITKYLPSYMGLLFRDEITNLKKILKPKKPSIAIIGGVKIDTKIIALEKLITKYDYVLIGTGMAKLFWECQSVNYGGKDLSYESSSVKVASKIYLKYRDKLILPIDVISAKKIDGNAIPVHKNIEDLVRTDYSLDIGPRTISLYSQFIKSAHTILWNGPLGVFELPSFKHGTMAIATLIGARSKKYAYTVVGGGETIIALRNSGVYDCIDYVSTGGGAMMEYLFDQNMPGIKALK